MTSDGWLNVSGLKLNSSAYVAKTEHKLSVGHYWSSKLVTFVSTSSLRTGVTIKIQINTIPITPVVVNKKFMFRLCTTIVLRCGSFCFLTIQLYTCSKTVYIADPAIFTVFADVDKYFEFYLWLYVSHKVGTGNSSDRRDIPNVETKLMGQSHGTHARVSLYVGAMHNWWPILCSRWVGAPVFQRGDVKQSNLHRVMRSKVVNTAH